MEYLPYLVAEEHNNKADIRNSTIAPYDEIAEKCIYHFAIGDFWSILRKFLREEEKEEALLLLQAEISPLRLTEEDILLHAKVAETYPRGKRDYGRRWEAYVNEVEGKNG